MYGLIITKLKSKGFTDLKEIFSVFGDVAKHYNWLLSSYECSDYPSEKIPFENDFVLLSGEDFVDILEVHEIQFIWGVATAYTKNISLESIQHYPLPLADGYEGFWNPDVAMQHPLADIEIVAWDSSLLLIIAKSKRLIETFAKEYPDSQDLSEYNRQYSIKKD